MILRCNCTNPYQDKTYGKGLRVANLTSKGNDATPSYRCTVCENMISKQVIKTVIQEK